MSETPAGDGAEALARIAELEQQLAQERLATQEARLASTSAQRRAGGLLALVEAGVPARAAQVVIDLPLLAEADFTTPDGVQQAVASLTAVFPALIAPPTPAGDGLAPLGGVGGNPRPATPQADPATLPMEAYIAYRTQQKG